MIGCLCSLARGYIEPQDIITMLQVPSRHSWLSGLCMAEPSGLYLYDVEYDPDDLILDAEEDN